MRDTLDRLARSLRDLLAEIAAPTGLTRGMVATNPSDVQKATFAQYPQNPEDFIAQAVRLINSRKAATVVEHLSYDSVEDRYGLDLFTQDRHGKGFGDAIKADRHVLEYVVTDSAVERNFCAFRRT